MPAARSERSASESDRFSHTYVIGKTGVGKTTLLETLISQDLIHGNGNPNGFSKSRHGALLIFLPTYKAKVFAAEFNRGQDIANHERMSKVAALACMARLTVGHEPRYTLYLRTCRAASPIS